VSKSKYQYGRGDKAGFWLLSATVVLVIGLAFFINRDSSVEEQVEPLVVYCAAGIKPPVEEAAQQFEKDLGVKIHLEYANSGVLAKKLKLDKDAKRSRADVYIPADYVFTTDAKNEGLTAEALKVASWKIVLGVKPGLNLEVGNVDELLAKKIPFVICEPLAGAGKKTKKILQASGKWEAVYNNKRASFPTVTEAALAVKDDAGTQAGFMWNSTAAQSGLKVIELPELEESQAEITVAVVSTTQRAKLALQFARYLAAPGKGGEVFARHKYNPIPGDAWAEVPKLRIDCGGVNREALEKTIMEFKEREGCEVEVTYAGCGTLVSKMQPGGNSIPDLFMTCDASYLDDVQNNLGNPFGPDLKVSQTRIGLLVNKGNPKGLDGGNLSNLTTSGLRIGITNSAASTLGYLSEQLFEESGQKAAIMKNVVYKPVTAHLLIQNIEGGENLDVVLVYEANVQHLKQNFDFLPIPSPHAIAIQNVAAKKTTPHPELARRLMEQITSEISQRRFKQLGFTWQADQENP